MDASRTRQGNSIGVGRTFRSSWLAALAGALVALLLCAALTGPVGADVDDDDGGEYVPGQIVVKLEPATEIGYINDKYGTSTLQRLPGVEKIYLLRTPSGTDPATLANTIQTDEAGRVLYAEPNVRTGLPEASKFHRARPDEQGKPRLVSREQYRSQYAVDNLNLAEAHTIDRGDGTVVAVIDTGVQADHPSLSRRLTGTRYDFVDRDGDPADAGNGRDDDGDGEADEMVGHGTHVAGIVALAAPGAKIMPLRALDSEGRGTAFGVARAIRYAVRNDADVVNLSLGSSQSTDLLEDLIGDDDDDDVGKTVFVAAAGNDNNALRQYPAAEEGAVSVTSVGKNRMRSDFANYGAWVSVAAPGNDIHSPFPNNRYAMWDGTSMATPFVAAQAALIRDARPSAGSACVAGIIGQTARASIDTSLRAGRADLLASTRYAANQSNRCPGGGDDD